MVRAGAPLQVSKSCRPCTQNVARMRFPQYWRAHSGARMVRAGAPVTGFEKWPSVHETCCPHARPTAMARIFWSQDGARGRPRNRFRKTAARARHMLSACASHGNGSHIQEPGGCARAPPYQVSKSGRQCARNVASMRFPRYWCAHSRARMVRGAPPLHVSESGRPCTTNVVCMSFPL